MKENDIIERLHKAYDAKTPDVLSKLNFSQVEMVPPPEKNLKKRYLSAVAVYAAACLVVALFLPFLIGRGGNDDPKPQPGVSPVRTEASDSTHATTEPPVDNSDILDEFMAALERAVAEGRIKKSEHLKRELMVELYPNEGAKYGIHVFMANNTVSYVYSDGEVYPVPVQLYKRVSDDPELAFDFEAVQFCDIDENDKYDLLLYGISGSGVPSYHMIHFDADSKTFTTLYQGAFYLVKAEDEIAEDGKVQYNLYAWYGNDALDYDSYVFIGELVYENGKIVPKLIREGTIEEVVRAVFGERTSDETVTTEPPISIDVYPIPVEPSETEPAIITTESPTPPEETTTTTGKRFDPVGTSATTKKPNPAPKVYADPADCVRIRFFKDMRMTQEYTSADDIPVGARVYYKIETDPGYICTNFSINVYGVGMDEIKDGLVGTNHYPFFDNNHLGDKLEYSLTAVLAGDADGNLMYDQSDVDTLNKYLAGDTTTIWLYGRDGYSEKLDYNCDGVINVNDRMQLQSEISTGAANRQVMPYYKYSHDVGTITYRLPTNINSVLPHGRSLNSVLTDGGTYAVYKSSASISGLSDEIREKYDDNFFMHYDLVLVYCYTEDDTAPIIHEELDVILCTESRNGAVLNPVIPEVKAGETLSDYAICIAASKKLNVIDDSPM